jgi:hypothetical protein
MRSEIEFTKIRNVVCEGSYRWREGDKKGLLDQASGLGAGKQNMFNFKNYNNKKCERILFNSVVGFLFLDLNQYQLCGLKC